MALFFTGIQKKSLALCQGVAEAWIIQGKVVSLQLLFGCVWVCKCLWDSVKHLNDVSFESENKL